MLYGLIVGILLITSPSWAATRYLDNGSSGCGTSSATYTISTRACGSGSETVYSVPATALAATASGDILYIRGGTYTQQMNNAIASGIGPGHSNPTTISAYNGEEVIFDVPSCIASGGGGWYIAGNKSSIKIIGIIIEANSCTGGGSAMYIQDSGGFTPSYITLDGVTVRNTVIASGLLAACNNCDFRITSTNNGDNNKDHCVYLGKGTNTRIHDSFCDSNKGWGIHVYSNVSSNVSSNIIEGNTIRGVGAAGAGGYGVVVVGNGHIIRRNVVYAFNTGSGGCIQVGITQSANNVKVYNNTCYDTVDALQGVVIAATPTGTEVRNNILIGFNSGVAGNATQSNNLTTGTATTIWVDPANDNLTLKAGSPAIGGGTNVGLPCNETCDQGAYETFGFSSGTITANTAKVVLGMSLNTPVFPTMAGWSLACTPNPTACITPVMTGVSLDPGSSSTVVLTFSGGNCSAGQSFTVTYDQSTGATTDTTGFLVRQELSAITTQPLTNECTGSGGPSPPTNPHIYYVFDENAGTIANDGTANNLDCTLTDGMTWGTGKSSSGVVAANGSTQHCAIPYGNAVNPSTQSLTIAVWIKPDVGSTGGIYLGTTLGTDQRLYVGAQGQTWRIGVQASSFTSSASELAFVPGEWSRVCLVVDSGTDIATLSVNGVASTTDGGRKAFTSFSLGGDFKLGMIPENLSPGATYDNFTLWTSSVSCADDWAAESVSSKPWTGNLSATYMQFYAAKTTPGGSLIPLAATNANITVPAGAQFVVAIQTDGTVSDPTPIAEKLWYVCANCGVSGTSVFVPNTATIDGVELWGMSTEDGLLTGDHGALLGGSLSRINGSTNMTADSVPVFDLAQNNSIVMRWIVRIVAGTPQGRVFCFTAREQTGTVLDGETPVGGICMTVGPSVAYGGF